MAHNFTNSDIATMAPEQPTTWPSNNRENGWFHGWFLIPLKALKFKNPHAPGVYPLGNIQKAIENGHLQLIYPLKMLIFHRFLYVYQSINQPFSLGQNQPPRAGGWPCQAPARGPFFWWGPDWQVITGSPGGRWPLTVLDGLIMIYDSTLVFYHSIYSCQEP